MDHFHSPSSSFTTTTIASITLLLLLLATCLWKRLKLFNVFSDRGIPGPPPSLLCGNFREIRSPRTTPMEVMDRWGAQFGSVYGYFAGTRPMLVVTDLDLVKKVLVQEGRSVWEDRPSLLVAPPPVPNTLVGLRGERWRQVRSLLSPLFSNAKIHQMRPTMAKCIEKAVKNMTLKADKNGRVKLDIWKLFQNLTGDVVSRCALAMEVDEKDDDFLSAVRGFLDSAMSPCIVVILCFPFIAKVAGFVIRVFGRSHKMTRMIMDSVSKELEARRKFGCERKCDMIQFMIDSVSSEGGSMTLTDEEIIANCWVFILGGFETTASALTFTTYLIAKHPNVQDKLIQEIRAMNSKEDLRDQLHNLHYMDQVISESLRLFPPVATFITRHTSEETTLGEWKIPKGVNVQVPVWQVHRDPEVWKDPEEFRPERFSQEGRVGRHPMAYLPFGKGHRLCIGKRFALAEVKLCLVLILRGFRILPPVEELKLVVPTVNILPDPMVGVPLVFELRTD